MMLLMSPCLKLKKPKVVSPESIESRSLVEEIEEQDEINVENGEITPNTVSEFDDIDLSLLDSEFNLELLFEEDSTEQVVSEIEELIAEEESEVPDASIPDNEPTTD